MANWYDIDTSIPTRTELFELLTNESKYKQHYVYCSNIPFSVNGTRVYSLLFKYPIQSVTQSPSEYIFNIAFIRSLKPKNDCVVYQFIKQDHKYYSISYTGSLSTNIANPGARGYLMTIDGSLQRIVFALKSEIKTLQVNCETVTDFCSVFLTTNISTFEYQYQTTYDKIHTIHKKLMYLRFEPATTDQYTFVCKLSTQGSQKIMVITTATPRISLSQTSNYYFTIIKLHDKYIPAFIVVV